MSTDPHAPLPGARCHNMDFLAHDPASSGVQIMVHKNHAFVGHAEGVSILDVSTPRSPKAVASILAPPGTWNIHLQTHGDLLLVVDEVNFHKHRKVIADARQYYGRSVGWNSAMFGKRGIDYSAGMRVFDISKPAQPRQIGYMPVEGLGVHRIWYDGGRYAYASALLDGYTDHIFIVIDMLDPCKPAEVARWWIPGMWHHGGETPTWTSRYALHHPLVAGNTAYCAWRDGGMTLLDIQDPLRPTLISHHTWSPPFGGNTHSCLPLPSRGLVIALDEAMMDNCQDQLKYTWVIDVREKANPVNIATFPTPSEQDYCALGGHFGPHNVHENRTGSFQSEDIIVCTYQNAGVRVVDIRNPFRPEEIAYFVPPRPAPENEGTGAAKLFHSYGSSDAFVTSEGLIFVCDFSTGLYVLALGQH